MVNYKLLPLLMDGELYPKCRSVKQVSQLFYQHFKYFDPPSKNTSPRCMLSRFSGNTAEQTLLAQPLPSVKASHDWPENMQYICSLLRRHGYSMIGDWNTISCIPTSKSLLANCLRQIRVVTCKIHYWVGVGSEGICLMTWDLQFNEYCCVRMERYFKNLYSPGKRERS